MSVIEPRTSPATRPVPVASRCATKPARTPAGPHATARGTAARSGQGAALVTRRLAHGPAHSRRRLEVAARRDGRTRVESAMRTRAVRGAVGDAHGGGWSRRWNAAFNAAAVHSTTPRVVLPAFRRRARRAVWPLPRGERCSTSAVAPDTPHSPRPSGAVPIGPSIGADLAVPLLEVARGEGERTGPRHVEFVEGISARSAIPTAHSTRCFAASRSSSFPTCPAHLPSCGGWSPPAADWASRRGGPKLLRAGRLDLGDALDAERPADQIPTGPSPRALGEPGAGEGIVRRSAGSTRRSSPNTSSGTHAIRNGDDWWTIVLGTGMRGVIDSFSGRRRRNGCAPRDSEHRRRRCPRPRHRRDLHRRHQTGVTRGRSSRLSLSGRFRTTEQVAVKQSGRSAEVAGPEQVRDPRAAARCGAPPR